MDEDTETYAKRLEAAYDDEAPMPPANVAVPDVFWYVHFKAFGFLKAGADEYRRHDALHQPPDHLPAAQLYLLIQGAKQILLFQGLSPDRPLEGVGVAGFYALLRLFHFVPQQQASAQNGGGFLDRMQMKHVADGRELTLYNLVSVRLESEQKADALPCPYCGKLLRTAFAKQCRYCCLDWHDPANVINRKAPSSA